MDVYTCTKCHITKPVSEFYRHKGHMGHRPDCKICKNQSAIAWAKANPDKVRGSHRRAKRRYWAKYPEKRPPISRRYYLNHAETIRQNTSQYYWDNHEDCLAGQRDYRSRNRDDLNAKRRADYAQEPEKYKAQARRSRQAHPDTIQASNARYRARKKQAPVNDLTATQWHQIKEHYDHRCVYCHRQMQRLTQDHLLPLSAGGSHTLSNVVPACQSCNSRKGNKKPLMPVQPLLLL